ncbi:MAG: LamG domain-containing protein, partial [Candidatus Thermoplasmatota archaeon]|nr:LamG domain-containing protein [Candidatus Thermoplasmatota archaeon]
QHGTLVDANGNSLSDVGVAGNGFRFSGDADFIDIGVINHNYPITYSVWLKADNIATARCALGRYYNGYYLGTSSSGGGMLRQQIFVNNTWGLYSLRSGSSNVWYLLTVTYDGNTIRYYTNNVEDKNQDKTGSLSATNWVWHIGDNGNSGYFWAGVVDEARIANSVFSGGWIGTHYVNVIDPSSFYSVGVEEEFREWNTINLFSGTISNFSSYHIVSIFNGTLFNATLVHPISEFNGSLWNESYWHPPIVVLNGSLFNTSTMNIVNIFNGVLWNSTIMIWHNIADFDGIIFNTSNYNVITVYGGVLWNSSSLQEVTVYDGVLYNQSSLRMVSEFNGIVYNQTLSHVIQEYSGIISNVSNIWNLVNRWDGTLFNTSEGFIWRVQTIWDGVIFNTTKGYFIEKWDGIIFNVSIIKILNPFPVDNATDIDLQPWVYATFINTHGYVMNITWYYGDSIMNLTNRFGTDIGVLNETISKAYVTATEYFTTYYWKVYVEDVMGNSENAIFCFRTRNRMPTIIPKPINYEIFGVLGLLGVVSIIFALGARKKKRRRYYF